MSYNAAKRHTCLRTSTHTYTLTQVIARGRETLPPLLCWRTPLVTFTAVMLLFTAFIYTLTSGAGACDDASHTHTDTHANKLTQRPTYCWECPYVDAYIQGKSEDTVADTVLMRCVICHFTLCPAVRMPIIRAIMLMYVFCFRGVYFGI